MFFVTYHKLNGNVHAYKDDGTLLEKKVLDVSGVELRGIYLESSQGNEYLYVVDGSKKESKIYCFKGSGTSYKKLDNFLTPKHADSIDHPFALAFDGQGNCFVSNQDTNVVAAFSVSSDGLKAKPEAVASYLTTLYPSGKFLQGTLVASCEANLPNAPQTDGVQAVPKELGGLDVLISTAAKNPKVQNSVRDVACCNLNYKGETIPLLFIVDEPAGMVRVYDPGTGKPLMSSNSLASPVHLLIEGSMIYVGAKDQVLSSPVPNPYDPTAPGWVFTPINFSPALPKGESVSGMAFDKHGNFHVAIRTKKQVMKYDSKFKHGTQWLADPLPDFPEFLLYVPD
jgi:hypothetical protein